MRRCISINARAIFQKKCARAIFGRKISFVFCYLRRAMYQLILILVCWSWILRGFCVGGWTEIFNSSVLLSGSPIEPSESSFEMNFYEFWWIWIFEREFFENHSEWVFVNMVFNIHCFTPFGVRGSLNKLQHSSFILFFTAFGTVSDDGFNNLVQKRHFWAKIVNFG